MLDETFVNDSSAPDRDSLSRSSRASRRLELVITILGLLGLALFVVFYDRAFPTAAIDLELSRAEILQRARGYLEGQGYDVADHRSALTFSGDSWASFYLQRTVGIPETNRLIREAQVPVWYWHARWFRPLQKEEFGVDLSPDGEVVALSHLVLEDAPGASLTQAQARALAQEYVGRDRGWDLDDWEEVSASSEDRPGGRTDHRFAWKRRDWDVGESELRLAVTVQGDRVGRYDYWLKVPEAFQRDFVQQRDVAAFVAGWSLDAGLVLIGLTLLVALWRARWQIPVTFSSALRPALAVAGIILLAGANELPLAKAWYGTTQEYALFWMNRLYAIGFSAAFTGGAVLVLWILGRWLSQQVWPRQDRILARRGDRCRRLARSGWRGLMLGLMMAGYAVAFYLVATRLLGGWTPMGPAYTYAYATPLPFLGALQVGLVPATWEELAFRLLGITAVLWLARSCTRLPRAARGVLALVVPGVLWGFAHLGYVRDPLYLRGIELTLAAVFLQGLFFLRFDLTTTIVAHFVYNAGLGAVPLLRSGEPYFVASGLVVLLAMLSPIMPYAVREARRRLRGESHPVVRPRIRPAGAGDVEALAALPIPLDEGVDWPALLADPDAAVLCLWAGDDLAGAAAGRIASGAQGRVLAIYVAPDWRRRYWGSELMEALCARLEAQGAESVEAQVGVEDKLGARFMASQGWRRVAVTFRWPVEPPLIPGWGEVWGRMGFGRRARECEGDG